MLDFTKYVSSNIGEDDKYQPDQRSRSYTPTKLITRSIRSKLPPIELKHKIDEKQKKAEELRNKIQREKEIYFRKTREKERFLKQK